jgi:hypothetical protein
VSLAAVIAALQLFVSQHPAGGAACMLFPANGASITRNDIRAIARAEVHDDEVIIVMGEPIPDTPSNSRMSAAQLLQTLTALAGERSKRSVVIAEGLKKVDERHSVDVHDPIKNTGKVAGPEGELFLLAAEASKMSPQEWLQLWKKSAKG